MIKKINKKGLTLIETIVALGILVTGILSVLTLAFYSINLSRSSEKEIVMLNLAREGVELVKQVRDFSKSGNTEELFTDSDMLFFNTDNDLDTVSINDGCYIIDSENNFNLSSQTSNTACYGNVFKIDDCSNCTLYQNNEDGFYSHESSGEKSEFIRAVKVRTISAGEKSVMSQVIWKQGSVKRRLVLETILTDW